jgi:hypothetical protein
MPAPLSCQAKPDFMNSRVGEILRLPVLSLYLITRYQFGNRHFVYQFAVREFEIRDCSCTSALTYWRETSWLMANRTATTRVILSRRELPFIQPHRSRILSHRFICNKFLTFGIGRQRVPGASAPAFVRAMPVAATCGRQTFTRSELPDARFSTSRSSILRRRVLCDREA